MTCLDINKKNYLVTGSIDNMVCFWNAYDCKINKQVQMPEELAPISQGNSICTFKFADPSSNEHLLVFMNYGEVYLLDTVSEKYTQQKDGSYELC